MSKVTKFKLQYAVVLIEDTTIVYDMLVITDKLHNIAWFDTEDDAVFNFAHNYRDWEEFPPNTVIKKVVKI